MEAREEVGDMEGAMCARSHGGELSAESEHSPGKGETSSCTARLSMRPPGTVVGSWSLMSPVKLLTANRMHQTNPALHRDACL